MAGPGRSMKTNTAQSISLLVCLPLVALLPAVSRYGLIAVDSKGDAMQLEKASLQVASGLSCRHSNVTAHDALSVVP